MNLLPTLFCIPCTHPVGLKYIESCSVAAKGHLKSLAYQQPGHLVWLAEGACHVRDLHVMAACDCKKMDLMILSVLHTTFSPPTPRIAACGTLPGAANECRELLFGTEE